MRYTVLYTKHAAKELKKLPPDVQIKIAESMDVISEDPFEHMKKLKCDRKIPLFSHRVGRYRVIFHIAHEKISILVIEIGDRKGVYKEF
jgi:mRNA interferase RelE/StbE